MPRRKDRPHNLPAAIRSTMRDALRAYDGTDESEHLTLERFAECGANAGAGDVPAAAVLHAIRSLWEAERYQVEALGRLNNVMLIGAGLGGFIRAGGKT